MPTTTALRWWLAGARAVILFAALAILSATVRAETEWRWEGVDRVVAVGDIHGAWDEIVAILRQTGLVDDNLAWAGGETHFVSVGDIVDRGPRSRDILDLFMRLEGEAAAAGGRVHVLLGNHETMNLTGELDYVAPGEFAAFAAEESDETREAAWTAWRSRHAGTDEAAERAAFDKAHPPGWFAHQAAFSPDGEYGRWLLSRNVLIVIDDTVFVHAGLSDLVADVPAQDFNRRMREDVERYAQAWHQLVQAGVLDSDLSFGKRGETAVGATAESPPALQAAAADIAELANAPMFDADGPVWYRGAALCHPLSEAGRLDAALGRFRASRLAVGHSPTTDKRIVTRVGNRAVLMDTGMLKDAYGGRASALVIEDGTAKAVYLDRPAPEAIGPAPRRVGDRPGGLDDDQIERALREGEIVSIEEVGQGVTRPKRVTIRWNGVDIRALFKTESTEIDRGSRSQQARLINNSDRYQYEIAAYRLDRLLDLQLVPVAVEREIHGTKGSLSFWVDNLISELDRQQESVTATGWCPLIEQYPLMFVFDALIYNVDRTQQNIVYDRDDWMLYLIDHSRAFRTNRGRPKDIRQVQLKMSQDLADRLAALDGEMLNEALGPWLTSSQIRALIKRRDEILEEWRKDGRPG